MILGKKRLMEWGRNGGITPFSEIAFGSNRANECCIDLQIGGLWNSTDELPIILRPLEGRNFVTLEIVSIPNNLVGIISTRSHYAKKHISHSTSTRVKPGWKGHIVLEIFNHGEHNIPIAIGDRICQLELHEVSV